MAHNKPCHSVSFVVRCGIGAGDGTRTRDIQFGKLTLYQLSYSRTTWYYSTVAAPCQSSFHRRRLSSTTLAPASRRHAALRRRLHLCPHAANGNGVSSPRGYRQCRADALIGLGVRATRRAVRARVRLAAHGGKLPLEHLFYFCYTGRTRTPTYPTFCVQECEQSRRTMRQRRH